MRLRGRVAVVTGAGRGIGRETALALAAEGVHLAVAGNVGSGVRSLADQVAAEHGPPVLPFAVDVADPAAVDRLVAHVEQQLGPVDLLVNDVDVVESAPLPLWEEPPEQSWGAVETALRGPFLLCRAVLPAMVARGHGHVVNVTGPRLAAGAAGGHTAHAVSRQALSALTGALAVPLAGTGVVVVEVLAGRTRAAMTASPPGCDPGPDDGRVRAAATAALVVEVALGRHDDRSGGVLQAAGPSGR